MRPDMDRVVIERPRRNSRDRNWQVHRERRSPAYWKSQLGEDGEVLSPSPQRRKMGLYGWEGKELSDFLSPLIGWLEKQAGRPWDKVYSEACQTLPRASYLNQHVFDHMLDWVELNAVFDEQGKPHWPGGRSWYARGDTRIYSRSARYPSFYVDRQGILRKAPLNPIQAKSRPSPELVWGPDRSYLLTQHSNGTWFYFEPGEANPLYRPPKSFPTLYSYYGDWPTMPAEWRSRTLIYRQLSKQEKKQYGVE